MKYCTENLTNMYIKVINKELGKYICILLYGRYMAVCGIKHFYTTFAEPNYNVH